MLITKSQNNPYYKKLVTIFDNFLIDLVSLLMLFRILFINGCCKASSNMIGLSSSPVEIMPRKNNWIYWTMKKPAFHFDEENLRLLLCPQT
jgi:hypothetical protein